MNGKFVFLGTGSSLGVPVIGCKCSVCQSSLSKNKRLRAGAFFEIGDKRLLIDAGPDFRSQALLHNLTKIDGFILTHAHYDHIGGFDDLKVYKQQERKLPCLMSQETFEELKIKYQYFIRPTPEDPDCSHFFSWHFVKKSFEKVDFQGVPIECVSYFQQGMKVLGIKVGTLAYISDIKTYEPALIDSLQGVETLVLSALRYETSPMHFSVDEALSFAKLISPKRTYFTHIAHEVDHELLQSNLPSNVFLAYDGLTLLF